MTYANTMTPHISQFLIGTKFERLNLYIKGIQIGTSSGNMLCQTYRFIGSPSELYEVYLKEPIVKDIANVISQLSNALISSSSSLQQFPISIHCLPLTPGDSPFDE